jgi:SHS2 domain-containing protein
VAKKFYEILEHTADIRIRVKAGKLETLFVQAARAMFDIIAEKKSGSGAVKEKKVEVKIAQKAQKLEDLFVNWLNDLLSLSSARGVIFSDFKIVRLREGVLKALARGERSAGYRINKEIKAATYHELQIAKTADGWKAEVIFDA